MNKDISASSSLSELSSNEIVVVDEIDHYAEEWIPPFAFREGISLNKRQKISDFYKFEQPIGEGKFGRVFKCIEKSTHLCLAAKCIKIKKDSELKQVENEISILTKMRHKCIAQIYDAYYIEKNFDKEVILIMEIVEGGELFDRVVEDSYILTELAIALIIHQICEAIKYIHSNNFIHLDLKPENIMCVSQSSNQIKLIDFGLAQHYDGEHDLLFMAGTPEFAAPEVIKYEPLNFHTDMWSVGVITYILLSGQSPFLGPNIAITYNKVEKGDWSFCDEFETNKISQNAKNFISGLLIVKKENRMLPEDCLNHPWLKSSLDKAHYYQSIKENPSSVQPISKEKLKNYLKNKKFRKIVFGVLFINQVLKMITTMQLKKNQKGLLYAKSLLHAAKLSEKMDDKIETTQSVTEIVTSSNNNTKKVNVKVKKVLKTKKVREGKVQDDSCKNNVIEKSCIKDNNSLLNKPLENTTVATTKKVELPSVLQKNSVTEGAKKSSSLKENRDELNGNTKNDDQKYLNNCANFFNTTSSKKLHSINEKLNLTHYSKDCDKQKNTGKVDVVEGNINCSSITETKKIKNTSKKNTNLSVVVDNSKICNQNMDNFLTTIEKQKLSIKIGDSKKIVVENQKLKEKVHSKTLDLIINCKNKEEKYDIQQHECEENNERIYDNTLNNTKTSRNKLSNGSKEISTDSDKKVKKIIKKTSVKKKVQFEQRRDLACLKTQLTNTVVGIGNCKSIKTDMVKEFPLNEKIPSNIYIINTQSQAILKDNSLSITNNDSVGTKISNDKLFIDDVKGLKKTDRENQKIKNVIQKSHEDHSNITTSSLSLQQSKISLQKNTITLESNKQLPNKESNKIERRKCVIRKKNIKKDESDIITEEDLKRHESMKETIKQTIHAEKNNIDTLILKTNNEESHKNTTKISSNKGLSKSLLNKSTVNIKSDTISLNINLKNECDEGDDDDVFSFAKLRNRLEQRLSNKKQKEPIDSDFNERSLKSKSLKNDLFESNGLCRVDFDNVKSVKNKWLKIEKETLF
uniref:Stretchin-Mlck (inferred by orthology to a D. melanogaster protein) n=1 Tax=Strongyloides venezuelensis TaxID=75913 RepID=A0A0K0EX48_STRVS